MMIMHEPKCLCSVVVYADPLAARRGQVGRTLQLYSGGGVEGATTPPSVNNTLALHRRQVETLAWKAAPQLEPRVSFQLLGGKSPVVVGAHVGEHIQLFWIVRNIKEYGVDLSTMPKLGEKGNLVSLKVAMVGRRWGGLPICWPASPQVSSRIPVVLCQPGMEGDAEASFGDRPFQCHTCAKKYLRKNNLEDHVLMEHPDTDQVGEPSKCRGRSSRYRGPRQLG